MITYVESNFVLELALGQEQADSAASILTLASVQRIELAIPTFGLSEPFSRIRQQARDRQRLQREIHPIERELRRAPHTQELADRLAPLSEAILELESAELERLERTMSSILTIAHTIELNAAIYQTALTYRAELDLELEDSIIFSCILADMGTRDRHVPKCFVSRDAKAFFDPTVESILQEYNCRYISRFPQAADYIANVLNDND